MWYCIGMALARGRAKAVALHDCDVLTYEKRMLAKLFYPVVNPSFNYEFCKGYYPRVAKGKMNGRVSRLLVYPFYSNVERISMSFNVDNLFVDDKRIEMDYDVDWLVEE